MDIIGKLSKIATGNKYIIVTIDYFTKWAEATPRPISAIMRLSTLYGSISSANLASPKKIAVDN